jgi:hypothetical protein
MTKTSSTVLAIATLLFAVGCGSDNTPVTVTSPSPSIKPSASPTPAPPAATTVCARLGNGNPRPDCYAKKNDLQLNGQVDAAIEMLIADKPQLFNLNDSTVPGSPRVLDKDGYFKGLISELDKLAVCGEAATDGQTMYVKADNDRSEAYRVLNNNNFVWRGAASYDNTCFPAAFPLTPADHIASLLVRAYGYRCEAGVKAPDNGSDIILPIGCGAQVTATPKDEFGLNVPEEIHGKEITWFYTDGADLMYCEPWKDEPFNLWCHPQGLGNVRLCATVLQFTTCMRFYIVPNPAPAP